jgi:hypothetical protein
MSSKSILLPILILGIGALSSKAQATPAIPQPDLVQTHPATIAQIKEYFVLTNGIVTAHKIMNTSLNAMQATSAPYFPKAFWEDMRSSLEKLDIESIFIPAYQKFFSEEDMQQVIAFYKSPAGQRLLEAQPLIVSATSDELRKAGAELGRQVAERHAEEIAAAKKKYDDEILSKQNSSKKQD